MTEPAVDLAAAAVRYAQAGWPVLPLYTWRAGRCSCGRDDCPSPAKHPLRELVPNGLKNATTDPDRVADWWARYPTANIGLRTGIAFDVLDVDGEEGVASLTAATEAHGQLPPGPATKTGGGGLHLHFAPTGAGNKAGLLPKVDWRGAGGYIVAPPSLHSSGDRYDWLESPDVALEPVPDWLRHILCPPRQERPVGDYRPLPAGIQDGTSYGLRAMEAELLELARAQQGERNHTLNACAFNLFQLVAGGELQGDAVRRHLEQTAAGIGLDQAEIRATIKSAETAGMAQPRSAPTMASRRERQEPQPPTPAGSATPEPDAQRPDPPRLLPLRWVTEVLDQPPPEPPVIIEGLLRAGELCVVGAPRAIGKSWMAMNLATLVSQGEGLFLGHLPVRLAAKVLVSQGELDEWGSWSRWDKLVGRSHPPPGVAETFERWRIRLVRKRAASNGRDTGGGWSESEDYIDAVLDGRVEATIEQHGFGVHIIDPWASYYAGAENSNDEAEAALDKLRDISFRHNAAVVIFTHFGKANEAREPEDLWRGASRLADWASTRVTLMPHYTASEAKERNLSRREARRYVDVSFLRRSTPTDDFSIAWNPASGWWDRWTPREDHLSAVAADTTASLAERITAALQAHPAGLNQKNLLKSVRGARSETIIETAKSLVDQNRIGMRVETAGKREEHVFHAYGEWSPGESEAPF